MTAQAQMAPPDRIAFNDQEVFLSGGNVAWVNFARDIGPGTTNLPRFESMFQQLSQSNGNAMRLWLHTTGAVTPQWNGSEVIGPGSGAIADLENILDLAWDNGIGLMLCLWSFDMLRISNGPAITDRAYDLLTDSTLTQTYIDNALIPMVEALGDHPAIIAWEIFNEPEGMSNEFGWSINRHVPMADIQRFINMTAGAIHRTHPEAQVTNGSWAFLASSDATPTVVAAPQKEPQSVQLAQIQQSLSDKYRHPFSLEETRSFYNTLQRSANFNYYTDERLIEAGGDSLGILDFYTVHYYEWAGTALSPFHHDYEVWGLTKPLVIAEFYMGEGDDGNPDAAYGIPYEDLFVTLFDRGYAGALAWQWYNYPNSAEGVVNWPRILESTELMADLFPESVVLDVGLRIIQFAAEPTGIERGTSSELQWFVSGATSVSLNGEPVDVAGQRTVSPDEATTYVLEAIDDLTSDTLREEITVAVLEANEVNRSRTKPALASTIESCCSGDLTAELAFDGNLNTRWSSAWDPEEADSDPDNEWIYVDLESAYDIERIVLRWEAAYGLNYNIDVSYDGRSWTTLHEARNGDGGIDEVVLPSPVSARYVRMQGLARATDFGYSLWEFEVYGLISNSQPPVITLTTPIDGAVLDIGADTTITAIAADPDGSIVQVDFYLNGELQSTATDPPYSFAWADVQKGDYTFRAVATDDDGIVVTSNTVPLHVSNESVFSRYEIERATLTGEATTRVNTRASGRMYTELGSNSIVRFDSLSIGIAGDYLLKIRYRLPAGDSISFNSVSFNNVEIEDNVEDNVVFDLRFNGSPGIWYERGLSTFLEAGVHSIEITNDQSLIDMDFLAISENVQNVAIETDTPRSVENVFALRQNYPNPFGTSTQITYSLPEAEHVRLVIFDAIGRRVATVVDQLQPSGTHTLVFDADHLTNGIYFYQVEAGPNVLTRAMVRSN